MDAGLFKFSCMSEDKILKKLNEHDKKFSEHDKRFDRMDSQFDFLAKKVLEHDERLDRIETNMVTKDEFQEFRSEMLNGMDKLVNLAEKKDQELTIATHDMLHIEDRVGVLEKDMKQVKPALGPA